MKEEVHLDSPLFHLSRFHQSPFSRLPDLPGLDGDPGEDPVEPGGEFRKAAALPVGPVEAGVAATRGGRPRGFRFRAGAAAAEVRR